MRCAENNRQAALPLGQNSQALSVHVCTFTVFVQGTVDIIAKFVPNSSVRL